MMLKQILVSSAVAFTMAVAGAALAGSEEKTEQMLKEEANMISGEGARPDTANIQDPVPSAEAQAKTEKMLKEEAAEISGEK